MASSARAARPSRRPALAWAGAIAIAGGALTGLHVTSATAKRGNARVQLTQSGASQTTRPVAPAPPAGATSTNAAEGGSAPASPQTPAVAVKRRHESPLSRGHGTGRAGGARKTEAPGGAAGGAVSVRSQPATAAQRRQQLGRGRGQTAQETETAAAQGGEAGVAGAAVAPAAKRQRKGRHGRARELRGREQRSKETQGEARGGGSAQGPSVTPTSTARTAAASGPVLATPSLVTSAVTPPVVVGQSSSPASSSPGGRRSRGTRSRNRTAAREVAPSTATAAVQPLLTAPVASAKRAPAATRPRAHHDSLPLATTVTKIINVVPSLVWIVIAALTALAFALGASSRVVALRARRLARQRRQLLEDVGLLQAALLPVLPRRLGPVRTSAAYRPASGPGAGGDFYDVFALEDGELAVIIGDVSGHGREALPHTTLLRFTLRTYLEAGMSPRNALQAATPALERQLGESFATVVLATYQPRERRLVYAAAGHPPPLVAGSKSIDPITISSSPPIGTGQPTGRRQTVVSVPGQALACFYTDGVVEARVGQELFGARRLSRALAELGDGASATDLLERVAEQSDRHPDDMAACLLRVEGEPLAPRIEVEELELDRRDLLRGRAERFLHAGGIEGAELAEALDSVRAAVARHGGVIIEVHLASGAPEVVLRPRNVAVLRPASRAVASAVR
jgi:hypothetical protein